MSDVTCDIVPNMREEREKLTKTEINMKIKNIHKLEHVQKDIYWNKINSTMAEITAAINDQILTSD